MFKPEHKGWQKVWKAVLIFDTVCMALMVVTYYTVGWSVAEWFCYAGPLSNLLYMGCYGLGQIVGAPPFKSLPLQAGGGEGGGISTSAKPESRAGGSNA